MALWETVHDVLSQPVGRKVLFIAVTWLAVLVLTRLNTIFFDRLDRMLTRFGEPERRLSKLDTMADFFIVLIGVFVTLFILGVGQALWGAVAVTSVAGVIIGLAAQQLGQNLLAGIMILFERPFAVGEFVEIDGRMGSVQKVTLHSTTLITPDGLQVMVPNSRVLNNPLTNFSRHPERRLVLTVDVLATERMDDVRAVLNEAVAREEHALRPDLTRVFVKQVLDEGVRFELQYWVQARAYGEHCLPSAMARVVKALTAAGFRTAMPAHRQYVRQEDEAAPSS